MPVVWIPSLLQKLTDGIEQVSIEASTLRDVIDSLEESFPGIKDRLCEEGRIRVGMAVAVDGVVSNEGMRHQVDSASEIHFVTAISGGN